MIGIKSAWKILLKNEVTIEFSWADRNSGNLMKRTEGPGGEIL